jgi:diguanylate cyclase (GGDEF)-like protein/PAS domain S-box-containing protein
VNIQKIYDQVMTHLDVSDSLKKMQREQHLKTLLDNFPFMVWLKDTNSRLIVANAAYAKIAGVSTTEELEGKTDFDFFPETLAKRYVEGDREAMRSDSPIGSLETIRDANGQLYWIETYKSALIINDQVVGSVGYARDVTESLKSEREYHSLVQNSPSAIVRYNLTNQRIFINPKIADFYQVTSDFLLNKTPGEFPGGESGKLLEECIQKVIFDGNIQSVDITFQVSEFDPEGNIIAVISIGQDVTDQVKNEAHIHRLAYYDSLTQLPNRAKFSDRLAKVASIAKQHGQQFALIAIDIDRFKEINDSLGHAVGDEILCASGKKLASFIRENDQLARIGVNEFAILLTNIKDVEYVSNIVCKIKQSQSNPYLIAGKEIFITLSMGIAIYPQDSDKVDELFKFADSALNYAKRNGRDNAKFYNKELTLHAIDRLLLETALRKALANHEFELHYQPQVNIETKEIIGAEALIRWNRDHKEIVMPDQFISIAEDSGLIVEIGDWVIKTACLAAAKCNTNRQKHIQFAINLSSRQFVRNDIVSSIKNTLIDTNCKPEWIKLEITESLLLEKEDDVKQAIQDLHAMGLQISLDDFGTGFSALAYLIHFPVNQIKIDRSFVNDITINDDRGLLVKAIISMATSLRMNVIAEGVETVEQASYLKESGCNFAQGYLYGKPMRYDQLTKQLRS